MATQAERRANTRAAILEAARVHFLQSGYADSSLSDVLRTAGVSRGAMYHHFSSKEDLFAAVFVQTSARAIRDAGRRVPSNASPIDALIAGCLRWLEVVSDPAISRLLFIDGPLALGWERCRNLEDATSLGVIRAGLAAAANDGQIHVHALDTTARLINALLAEAALAQTRSDANTSDDTVADITAMITGLSQRR